MTIDRFDAQMTALRTELEMRARARDVITYGEAAKLVGLANQGLRPILEAIMDEEAARGRPDLGCLVVKTDTLYPSYVGVGAGERRRANAQREAVFQAWARQS